MKFPRNARIFRGQLDAAPFAAVFFLLIIFLWLAGLIYTPGVPVELPAGDGWHGTDKPTISVAMDSQGQIYYENQIISEADLRIRLRRAVKDSREPMALVILGDKHASHDMTVRLATLARDCGMSEAILATLPTLLYTPNQ